MTHSARTGPTILVANDHEWTARSVETILTGEGYDVVRAFTAKQALERLATVRVDACILDVQLPDRDGRELAQAIRGDPSLGPSIPILLTTAGASGRQERLAAYRAGAWEFFGQPLDGDTLLLKLRLFLDAKAVVDDLRRESLVDETTGLYSRSGLVRRARELAAESARRGRPLACLVLRPALRELQDAVTSAEAVARQVGQFLRSTGRSADAIGRVAPLEFAIVATDTGDDGVRQLFRRLNDEAAGAPFREVIGAATSFQAGYCSVANAAEGRVDPEAMLTRASNAIDPLGTESLASAPAG
jgi:PleD family two-component response regulator